MIEIIVLGNNSGTVSELKNIFMLKKSIIIDKDKYTFFGTDYILSFNHIPNNFQNEKGIIILLDYNGKSYNLPEKFIGICQSDNISALEFFMKNKNPVITFGMQKIDTVTIGSLKDNEFQISLQREIKSVFGKKIEPKDYTVKANYSPMNTLLIETLKILLEM